MLCADGLAGMNQAVEAIFPHAIFQTCGVHVIRSSTRFVPWSVAALCARGWTSAMNQFAIYLEGRLPA